MNIKIVTRILCLLTAIGGLSVQATLETDERILAAAAKALPLIENASAVSLKERSCYTCHNGGASVFAIEASRTRGLAIDKDNFLDQLQRAYTDLRSIARRAQPGAFAPGQADGAGWKLLTLAQAGWPRDENTDSAVQFLIDYNRNIDHWTWSQVTRPPTVGSEFTSTWAALAGLREYAAPKVSISVALRTAECKGWLLRTESIDTEDSVSKLRSLRIIGANPSDIGAEAKKLLRNQRTDGGWSQLNRGESDAYATSTALIGLYETGQLEHDAPESRRALNYLLESQLEDGSWHVVKRAPELQPHYESSFPHERDQFISAVATSWAVYAMLQTIPKTLDGSFLATLPNRKNEVEIDYREQMFSESEIAFFRDEIEPVLIESCYKCHSQDAKKLKADLYLDSRDGILFGGDNGPAILPGEPEGSLLIDALTANGIDEMPPKKGPLSSETIALFEQWIKMGAPHDR